MDKNISIVRFLGVLIYGVVLLLSSTSAWAQSGKVHFAGRVVDTETHQPVGYAAVRLLSLPDSALIVGGVSKDDGKFSLSTNVSHNKKLLLHVSFIGYTPVYQTLSGDDKKSSVNLGDISFTSQSIDLDETVIVAQAPMAVTEEDTTVFNASAYRTPEGSMLEDLVKQLPGSEISADGKLLIQGKEVKKILVDGKEFFSDDPKAALKNLPVEMVEKLKAYERKSDLARLTGIDDGEEEMILDLSVKKDMKQGWMENFFGGVGNKGRYELGNTLNRFRENSQLTVIGNWNNTNNQGFSELQQESASSSGNGRNRAGLITSRSLGVNLTHDWSRVKLRSNVQYTGTDRLEESRTTINNLLRQNAIARGANDNRNMSDNLIANAYLEWKIDTVTNLVFRPQYRYSSSERNNRGHEQSWATDTLLNEKESSSQSDNSQYNLGMMLQINRKLSRMGRNIALKFDYGTDASSSGRLSYATTRYFKSQTEKVTNQKIDNGGDGYNYRLQLVYVEPLPWSHFLQFRYSYQYRANDSDRFVYKWDKENEQFMSDYDSLSSNRFENQYSNHLFNLAVRTNRKKYNYNIGVDVEPQKSVSYSYPSDALENPFTKQVLNVSPTVNFRYKFSKRTRLQVVYRGKSKQPDIRDLRPIADNTNPLNIRIGNPSLKPSYTNTFTLNYNSYNAKRQSNMVLFLLAENTINSVTSQVTYDSESDGRTTMPVNMNGNWRAQGTFSFNTPVINRNWTLRTYSYLQFSNKNGYSTRNKEEPMKNTVRQLAARERLKLTYRTQQMELGASAEVLYNNSHNNLKDTRTETYDYKAGAEVQYYLPWGFELNSDLMYYLRTGYGLDEGNENLMWNLQLSKSFLKRKQLLLRFKIYDILRQETSLVRSISTSSIRDTDYNVPGSYFMVHAIVRLNMMGK